MVDSSEPRNKGRNVVGDSRKLASDVGAPTHPQRPRSEAGQSAANLAERRLSSAQWQPLQRRPSSPPPSVPQQQRLRAASPASTAPTRRWSSAAAGDAGPAAIAAATAAAATAAIELRRPEGERNGGVRLTDDVAAVDAASGDDSYDEQLREALFAAKERALLPLKEDVAGWLNALLDVELNAENLMEQLQSGTLLCMLARLIDARLKPERACTVRFHSRAPAGSFLARDNASAFLAWAREFGVDKEWLFESDGLVLRRDPQRVVLSLLGVARAAVARGLAEAPALVAMERDLPGGAGGDQETTMKIVEPEARRPSSSAGTKAHGKTSALDRKVAELAAGCQCCPSRFRAQKVSEGVYLLGDRQSLVRLLNDRHVMIRVGGGWDTLEHYLLCHDPCRILIFRRSGAYAAEAVAPRSATSATQHDEEGRFLHIKGKYKSQSTLG